MRRAPGDLVGVAKALRAVSDDEAGLDNMPCPPRLKEEARRTELGGAEAEIGLWVGGITSTTASPPAALGLCGSSDWADACCRGGDLSPEGFPCSGFPRPKSGLRRSNASPPASRGTFAAEVVFRVGVDSSS